MTKKPLSITFFAILAVFILSSGCVSYLHSFFPAASYPEIEPQRGATIPAVPDYIYPFEEFLVTLSSDVDPEVYAGAQSAEKGVRIYDTSIGDDEWRSGLYRAMTLDPAQGTFFDNLTGEFSQVRATYDLDSDEYLELMTVFVQSLQYRNQNLSSPKYPVETYYDREGDCDDKSMLLASLLAHEGYNVSLLYFGPEQHMAVGVACQEEGYRDTGYAYIETTRVSFVGSEAGSLEGNITLVSDPLVISIGSGTKGYTRCGEIRAINDELFNISARLELLATELRGRESSLLSRRSDIETMDRQLEMMLAEGDYFRYNRLVSEYNTWVGDYNQDLEVYQKISDEYSRLAEHYNYIISHEHDREGTYRYLFGEQW
ncbi:MAG TPA: hypothetical protein PLV88_04590 [Methanoregulaceae archaeon]|nr:hypothetical protein [Methanoregulaceae archaeon]HNO08013.1 hypothetical protein [Methanoregulaceae archaeon]